MGQEQYDALIERIRQHCQKVMFQRVDRNGYCSRTDYGFSELHWDSHTFLALRADETEMPVPELAFPPVTEEQVQQAEAELGFPLPPFLRRIYLEVANGGFGPGYGIIGLPGGYPLEDGFGENIVQHYQLARQEGDLVRLEDYEMIPFGQWRQSWSSPSDKAKMENMLLYVLPPDVWPLGLLPFCYWGCAICTYIDARTGHIFQATGYGDETLLLFVATSPEEWLSRWLDGEALQFL